MNPARPPAASAATRFAPGPGGGRNQGFQWVLAWLFLFLFLRGPALDAQTDSAPVANEYSLKAAFLYKFTGFIDWPPAAFPTTTSPFVVGIVGDDPFGAALDSVVARQKVHGRRIEVRRLTEGAVPDTCHLLFVGERQDARRKELLKELAGRPVLLVGEAQGFLEDGGMIRLMVHGERVRFEVNNQVSERAGLRISSKLLSLAVRVVVGNRNRPDR